MSPPYSRGEYLWVKERLVMSAATVDDIPLLQDIAAALYTRLSDECLPEIKTVQEIMQRLARKQYRKDAGICDKVEPL